MQEAHKDMAKKAQDIEDDSKKQGISIKDLADALEHFKVANWAIPFAPDHPTSCLNFNMSDVEHIVP